MKTEDGGREPPGKRTPSENAPQRMQTASFAAKLFAIRHRKGRSWGVRSKAEAWLPPALRHCLPQRGNGIISSPEVCPGACKGGGGHRQSDAACAAGLDGWDGKCYAESGPSAPDLEAASGPRGAAPQATGGSEIPEGGGGRAAPGPWRGAVSGGHPGRETITTLALT